MNYSTANNCVSAPPQNSPKTGHKVVRGLSPSFFYSPAGIQSSAGAGLQGAEKPESSRYLIVSIRSSGNPKKETTNGRKYITHNPQFQHEGSTYRINVSKSGINTSHMHKIIQQVDVCLAMWNRVLIVRFELHQKFDTGDSKYVRRFFQNFTKKLKRHYRTEAIGYMWSRENHGNSAFPHYHAGLMIDGGKARTSHKALDIGGKTWKGISADNVLNWSSKRCYHFVTDEQAKQEAIHHLSYLAKSRGKESDKRANEQAKTFMTSRISA